MPGWLIVEYGYPKSRVDVLNLGQVLDFNAFEDKSGRVIVEVYSDASGHIENIELKDWSEVEKFINILPGIDQLGWILIRDGKVDNWRGRLAVKDVKELAEEEENEILEGVGDE